VSVTRQRALNVVFGKRWAFASRRLYLKVEDVMLPTWEIVWISGAMAPGRWIRMST
jgi:hypothetical protein